MARGNAETRQASVGLLAPLESRAAENETVLATDKSKDTHDKVGNWLRNIEPRLESFNNSASILFGAAASTAGPSEPNATLGPLSKAQTADHEAISQLRLDGWDHEFFKQRVKREQEEVQDTIKSLQDRLQREKTENKRLENELSEVKEGLGIRTISAEENKRLQSELTAYKMIAQAEWKSEMENPARQKRKATSADDEDVVETSKRRRTQPIDDLLTEFLSR